MNHESCIPSAWGDAKRVVCLTSSLGWLRMSSIIFMIGLSAAAAGIYCFSFNLGGQLSFSIYYCRPRHKKLLSVQLQLVHHADDDKLVYPVAFSSIHTQQKCVHPLHLVIHQQKLFNYLMGIIWWLLESLIKIGCIASK